MIEWIIKLTLASLGIAIPCLITACFYEMSVRRERND